MIKFPELPALGVMTGITFRPQPLFMDIPPHVAVHAFRRSFLVLCRKMTVFTGGHRMNARQREFRFIVIELDPLAPALLIVTLVTFFSLLSLVNIIRLVTVITKLTQLFLVGVSPVTGQARQLGMTFHQLELGVLIVIEFHLGPFDKTMTGFTFFTQTPFVVIVTPVTVDTFSFQLFLEIVSLVTGVALHLIMGAAKRELGFIVVELGFRPTYGVVAFVTFFPKSPLVNIVKRMTGETFRRCIFIALVGMTTVARHFLMLSRQPEFGLVMVEPAFPPGSFRMTV